MKRFPLFKAVLLSTLLGIVSPVGADMYKYVDDAGSVTITNNIDSVPKKYRASMKVVKEETPLSQQKLLPEIQKRKIDPTPSFQTAQPQSQLQKESSETTADKREQYINTGLVIAGLIAGYFILIRLTGSLGFPGTGMVAFVLLVLTSGAYLYKLYIQEMSATFTNLHKDAIGMKKNVETRENKTEQMLKKMPEAE